MVELFEATTAVAGTAGGPALRLDEPLSLWGGLDVETGLIIDRLHPQHGVCVTATVLLMPAGRGSSSASSVLAEAIRIGTAPAAIVLGEPDEILTLGSLVGEELYGTVTPMIVCPALFDAQPDAEEQLVIDHDRVTRSTARSSGPDR